MSVRRVTLGREPHTYCLCFPLSLQDNPEVEKRDPQELVGEYPGVEGARGRSLSLTQSQVASLCFHRGSSSAMNLSLDSDSQGLWHFLRRLGETPREQFFENCIYGAFQGALVSCQCRQEGLGPLQLGACSPCALRLASGLGPPEPLRWRIHGLRAQTWASAGMLLCPREGACLPALEPGALCVTGQGGYGSGTRPVCHPSPVLAQPLQPFRRSLDSFHFCHGLCQGSPEAWPSLTLWGVGPPRPWQDCPSLPARSINPHKAGFLLPSPRWRLCGSLALPGGAPSWKCCIRQPLQPVLFLDRMPSPGLAGGDPFWLS